MKYVIVDDEQRALNLLKIILERFECLKIDDEIFTFSDSTEAYDFVLNNHVDLIFLDFEMPKMTGKDFTDKMLIEMTNIPEIIYITAFPQYSLYAWEVGAIGYIVKPYAPKQVYKLLEKFLLSYQAANNEIYKYNKIQSNINLLPHIRCFPDFELFVNKEPVFFKSKKSKELLALLVHNNGNWVDIEKITFCLLENLEETSSKNYYRTILYRLKQTLSLYGLTDIIESKYGSTRVNTEKFVCDYYDYLNGNKELFHGDYMGEYSWAETTKAIMWKNMK